MNNPIGVYYHPSPQHVCGKAQAHIPEIVAGRYIVLQVPGVEAPEGVSGQAEGGSSVQVAVPLDLNAHDASLWGKQERHGQAFRTRVHAGAKEVCEKPY